jgi:hypothetical protein
MGIENPSANPCRRSRALPENWFVSRTPNILPSATIEEKIPIRKKTPPVVI